MEYYFHYQYCMLSCTRVPTHLGDLLYAKRTFFRIKGFDFARDYRNPIEHIQR